MINKKIKNKDENFNKNLDQTLPKEINLVTSKFEFNFAKMIEDLDEVKSKKKFKPILLSGSSGSGKTEIIKNSKKTLKEIKPELVGNLTYINCKNFLDTINEQKNDFFKHFITRISNQVTGDTKNIIEKNDNNAKSIWIAVPFSIMTLFFSLFSFLKENLNKTWIFIVFFISLSLFFITVFLICWSLWKISKTKQKWVNYEVFFKSLFKKSRLNQIIIFDEINRLVIPQGENLGNIEKKFIKEMTSLNLEGIIFIFVTSDKLIENANEKEEGFLLNYFNEIYKVEINEKIKLDILEKSIYFNNLSYETKKMILGILSYFDYRTTKSFLIKIENISEFLDFNTIMNIDEETIYLLQIIKHLMFHNSNFSSINFKISFNELYLLKDDFIKINKYMDKSYNKIFENNFEKVLANYKKHLTTNSNNSGMHINKIFEDPTLKKQIMEYNNKSSIDLQNEILDTYTFINSKCSAYKVALPKNISDNRNIFLNQSNWFKMENTFFQHALYDFKTFEKILNYKKSNEIFKLNNYEYWLKLWIVVSLKFSNLSFRFLDFMEEEIIDNFLVNDGLLIEIIYYKANYDLNQMFVNNEISENFISEYEFWLINNNSNNSDFENAKKFIKENAKNFKDPNSLYNVFLIFFYKNKYNFFYKFNWEMCFSKNAELNRKEMFDYIYNFFPKSKAHKLIRQNCFHIQQNAKTDDENKKIKKYLDFLKLKNKFS